MKLGDFFDSAGLEHLAAVGGVIIVSALTFVLARWLGQRLRGITCLGLRGLERLAAPVTLFVVATSAALWLVPIARHPELLSLGAEAFAVFAVFWLVARSIDVIWTTSEGSARLRHHPAARAVLTTLRHLGRVVVWAAAAVTLAERLGAARHLYLLLGGLGAALAFAARAPIRNAFAFVSMLLDPPFRLGDKVRLEEFRGGIAAEGTVVSMSVTAVKLETPQHTQVVVANVRVGDLRAENLSMADRRRLELLLLMRARLEQHKDEGRRARDAERQRPSSPVRRPAPA